MTIPETQQAAVYHGKGQVRIEEVPVPALEDGEVLVRVAACGVCGTDLKKVELGLQDPPRIYGHETAGRIAATCGDTNGWKEGDRVAIYHHVPERDSWFARRGLYAQCAQYKQTGVTAGFEPAGGGYAEYVRVMPWIVREGGLTAVPEDVPLEEAAFIEPVNTALKAVRLANIDEGDLVVVVGLGSIGLILMQLAAREGAAVIGSDPLAGRRERARLLGAAETIDPLAQDLAEACRDLTDGRGADHALIATPGGVPVGEAVDAVRPGGTVLLFSNTRRGEEAILDVGDLCMSEKRLLGSYSASPDLAEEAARVVFDGEIDVGSLISHRFPLAKTADAFRLAAEPGDDLCKVMVLQAEGFDG